MPYGFTKLFESITSSSIWSEPSDTRVVWITMLAMADRQGEIHSAVPGLANRAQVPLAAVEVALEKFLAPDPYSRTTANEGRRVEVIMGGWKLLNHALYREMRDDDKERARKAKWAREDRAKKRVADRSEKTSSQALRRATSPKVARRSAKTEDRGQKTEGQIDLPSEDPVAPAEPKRRVSPLTTQRGLLGELARSWSQKHSGEPEWAKGECIRVSKLAQKHTLEEVYLRWDRYLAHESDFFAGHPLSKFVTSSNFDRFKAPPMKLGARPAEQDVNRCVCGCPGSQHVESSMASRMETHCLGCGKCDGFRKQ